MKINDSAAIYLGSQAVDRLYMGSELVWQKPVPTGIIDQANLVDQWLASDVVAAEGARVPTWTGRINGLAATQATDSRRPRFFGGAYGLPGLLFSGSTLTTPPVLVPHNMTVYIKVSLAQAPSSTPSTLICQDITGNDRSWHCGVRNTDSARYVNFQEAGSSGASVSVAGAPPLSTWFIVQGRRTLPSGGGVQSQAIYNAVESSVLSRATTNLLAEIPISIGSRGAFAEAVNGYINEIRLYRAAHDAATMASIRQEMGIA